jgi:hypothetical protein
VIVEPREWSLSTTQKQSLTPHAFGRILERCPTFGLLLNHPFRPIDSPDELSGMRIVGAVVRRMLDYLWPVDISRLQ